MLFKKRTKNPNKRKKLYYTFKITEEEYLKLRSFLKENKMPYKRRIRLNYKISKSVLTAIALLILLFISAIIFIKIIN